MDPVYLQGLREAKALVDDGIFSQEVLSSSGVVIFVGIVRLPSAPRKESAHDVLLNGAFAGV